MNDDRPFAGILLMLGFCIAAPAGDAMAKLIGASVALPVVVAARFAVQAAVLVPLVLLTRRGLALPRAVLGLAVLRTAVHVTAIALMFLSLRYLPLADAIAIAYVMPFILLLLGRLVLGEEVGIRRLSACAVGFAGTLMVVQPALAEVGAPALLPLAVAALFALFMLLTRRIAKAADVLVLQAVNGLIALPLLVPWLALAWWTASEAPAAWPADFDRLTWLLLGGLGLLGTAAHLMMTWSLRLAPTATVAPMQYLEIPAATVLGWLVFRDLPNGLALAGILVTVAAGVYVILRERRPRPAAPRPPA